MGMGIGTGLFCYPISEIINKHDNVTIIIYHGLNLNV